MGLSGSTKTQTYTPNAAQTTAANNLANVYNANASNTQNVANQLGALVPGLASTVGSTNQGVGLASSYYNDVLGGKYLSSGNPYLTGQLTATDNAIRDQVNGSFSAAGRTGSGANTYALAKAIGENENNLRYSDYNNQLSRMDTTAANASTLNSQTLASLLGLASTATGLPLQQAQQYASGIGSLGLGGTTTQTGSTSLLDGLGSLVGLGTDVFGLGQKTGLWK